MASVNCISSGSQILFHRGPIDYWQFVRASWMVIHTGRSSQMFKPFIPSFAGGLLVVGRMQEFIQKAKNYANQSWTGYKALEGLRFMKDKTYQKNFTTSTTRILPLSWSLQNQGLSFFPRVGMFRDHHITEVHLKGMDITVHSV